MKKSLVGALRALGATLALFAASAASATAITTDGQWYEFQFGGTGSFATACTGCVPGVGSVFVGAPAWTFSGPTSFSVVDGFALGDVFSIFDNNILVGQTSTPSGSTACATNDPACLLSEGVFSRGTFALGGGDHSITIQLLASPFGGGAAFFNASPASVPEPASLALFGLGLVAMGFARRRKQQ